MPVVTLDARGYRGEPVPNRLISQKGGASHLAVLLPGRGYTVDMPLLYYPRAYLMDQGADVLLVEYNYARADYNTLPPDDQRAWLNDDVDAVVDAALAGRTYERVTLIGKSLGTYAMAHLLATDMRLRDAACLWLTPIIHDEAVFQWMARPHRALFAIGTRDPLYDEAMMQEAAQKSGGVSVVIDDADHGLNIERDMVASVRALETVMQVVQEFLKE
jgi:fermentation-respiration switch protein FrsA (DUF1100 family)